MHGTNVIPVIAGLAVGIAFVAAFSFLFSGSTSALTNEGNQFSLTIEGMKSTYRSGEKIVLSVNAIGTSENECNIYSPTVYMRDESSGETILFWPHSFGFSSALMCVEATPINKEWTFGDDAESEIVLDKPGSYTAIATLEGIVVEKKFIVTS